MKKPIIGITCPWSVETKDDPVQYSNHYVKSSYPIAVHESNGIPMLIVPEYNDESLDHILDSILEVVDGLIFSGGGYVQKKHEEEFPTLRGQQPIRYDFEEALMKKAYEREIPILGICRGFQMMVEVFGGSLSDDTLDNHTQNIALGDPWHDISINKDSRLYDIIGKDEWGVNSFHVQKIETMPEGFIISGKAEDGVIEGIEAVDYPFLTGFQFHPEEMIVNDESAKKIFEWFMKESSI